MNDPVLYFIQRLRDEAHRWAIGTHRAKRAKAVMATPLDEIAGRRRRAQTRAAGAFRQRQGGQPRGLADLMAVDGIVERLRHHGFADYDAFAAQVVADEMRSRDSRLGVAAVAQAEGLSHLLATLIETLEEQSRLVTQFADLVLLPVNMRLVAARLEPQGGPISQISVNYKLASEEISRRLTSIVSGKGNICGRMAQGVRQSLTLSCFVRLQQELIDRDDRKANENSPEERRREMAVMREVRDGYRNQTSTALSEAIALAAQLSDASADLRRMILGLDTIRILARVESRKSTESQAALTATIDRIDEVQGLIGESLKRMSMQTATINAGLAAIQRERGTAAIAAS
jgi:hypothetical protein